MHADAMCAYFARLSNQTRRYFGPHAFDRQTVIDRVCSGDLLGFVAIDQVNGELAAYTVVKPGYLDFEMERLASYGLVFDGESDYTIAPSVADAYQSKGLGSRFFAFVLAQLRDRDGKKVVLWGGVQTENTRAYHFYLKQGFEVLGEFEHNGRNVDMLKYL